MVRVYVLCVSVNTCRMCVHVPCGCAHTWPVCMSVCVLVCEGVCAT